MEREREGERNGVDISVLPEGCISNIVSLTSPKDACTACVVSPIFRAAAESNAVWERFLPPDYQAIIARSSSTSLDSLNFSSKKQLYLSLSDNPILIDDNKKVLLTNNPILWCYPQSQPHTNIEHMIFVSSLSNQKDNAQTKTNFTELAFEVSIFLKLRVRLWFTYLLYSMLVPLKLNC